MQLWEGGVKPTNFNRHVTNDIFIYHFDILYLGDLMARTLIDLQGPQELILEKALELGLYKTKAEAVRGAINDLGKEYKIFKDAQGLEDELVARKMLREEKEIKAGKRKILSEHEVKKKYGFK